MSASTVLDIAREAGVSQATVSQVLNGKGRISDATRHRVLEVAQALGYRPNSYARAMLVKRTGNIGLLLSDRPERSVLFPSLMDGIQDVMTDRRTHLIVGRVPDELLTDRQHVPRLLTEFAADGLLINYFQGIPPTLRQLIEAYNIPVVWMNTRDATPCVWPDDCKAAVSATQRFLQAGHTRVAYLSKRQPTQATDAHYSIADRLAGYCKAMKLAGLKPRVCEIEADYQVYGTDRDERIRQVRESLFNDGDQPTAIITYEVPDVMVAALAAYGSGRFPGIDIQLCTFHADMPPSLAFPVTLWRIPMHAVGALAARTLLRRISSSSRNRIPDEQPVQYREPQTAIKPPSGN